MVEYEVQDFYDTHLLLSSTDHWLIVDLVPGDPIKMTRYEDESTARAAFAGEIARYAAAKVSK
jgi:hypothetical protein